jgi:hypothetical protein
MFSLLIITFFDFRIYSGMKIISRLGNVETDKDDRPLEEVRILSAKIDKY